MFGFRKITKRNSTSLISEIEEINSESEVESYQCSVSLKGEALTEERDPLAEFTALLNREIALLNGSVVPKLNWSTPKVPE